MKRKLGRLSIVPTAPCPMHLALSTFATCLLLAVIRFLPTALCLLLSLPLPLPASSVAEIIICVA
jgi:hypothetical protein